MIVNDAFISGVPFLSAPQCPVEDGRYYTVYCPACGSYWDKAGHKVKGLEMQDRPLEHHQYDPYTDHDRLDFVRSGHQLDMLGGLAVRRAQDVKRRAANIKLRLGLPEWLLIFKKTRGAPLH